MSSKLAKDRQRIADEKIRFSLDLTGEIIGKTRHVVNFLTHKSRLVARRRPGGLTISKAAIEEYATKFLSGTRRQAVLDRLAVMAADRL